MATLTIDEVEEWALSLTAQDLNLTLHELQLKEGGSRVTRVNRLTRWLLGDYTASEFVPNEDENAVQRRVQLRESFIDQLTKKDDADEDYSHPLERVLEDPAVAENLQKSVMNLGLTADATTAEQQGNDVRQRGTREVMVLKTLDGREFEVPSEFMTGFAEIMGRLDALEDAIIDREETRLTSTPAPPQRNPRASSTRLSDICHRRKVNFNDTRTIHYDEDADVQDTTLYPNSSQTPQTRGPQSTESLGRGESIYHDPQSSCRQSSTSNMSMGGPTKDIGQIVRRWQFRFKGDNTESIDTFLTKVENARTLANLSEEQVLSSLSELLQDKAAAWYEVQKTDGSVMQTSNQRREGGMVLDLDTSRNW